MSILIAALSLGLLGSFHCIGMCGPIALAIPVHQYTKAKKYLGILLYNIGRVTTYTIIGLLFGLLGQSFFIAGFQQILSIGIGCLLIIYVIIEQTKLFNLSFTSSITGFVGILKNKLGNLFSKKGLHILFLIGLLNGLLPCGLVYLGIAGSIATGDFIKGAEFMFYFGLGTIPMMYLITFLGQFVTIDFRNTIRKTIPYVTIIMAIMLILRGLNLGIPYLSPSVNKQTNTVECCEKPEQGKETTKPCCNKK